ncbi:cell division protein FtsL [Candidatus Puniceispirillum marinum]|uniref:Secreted (Periplasmic) protein-like protein n=1 Tax=Puniceispirillum marinum (strain IMCC1322) TaxID=488538 RepID=D5BPT2_PUNMI|nr:hypothetical protein [Candidatus Puniceispirillum marinum]ADE40584.1 secreted (periplasmic) protein-like protein [Candidatus Puniceispirillum marinum IMCC1322]
MRMILIGALVLAGLGTTLYQVKTGIDARQDRLNDLKLTIAATKRDIAVLEAEWAYLSRPERIMTLSSTLLNMEPISYDRILPLDAIPMRVMSDTDSNKPTPIVQLPAPKAPKARAINHSEPQNARKTNTKMSVKLPDLTLKGVNLKAVLADEDKP